MIIIIIKKKGKGVATLFIFISNKSHKRTFFSFDISFFPFLRVVVVVTSADGKPFFCVNSFPREYVFHRLAFF
jgi:hypothetical protein